MESCIETSFSWSSYSVAVVQLLRHPSFCFIIQPLPMAYLPVSPRYGKTWVSMQLLPCTKKALWFRCFQTYMRHGLSIFCYCCCTCLSLTQEPCNSSICVAGLFPLSSNAALGPFIAVLTKPSNSSRGQAGSMCFLFHEHIPVSIFMVCVSYIFVDYCLQRQNKPGFSGKA